jgi:tripartite ATP-independent transporter DctP family solute receptor
MNTYKPVVRYALLAAAVAFSCAASAQTVLKFSHTDQQQGARQAGAQLFAKKVAEYTQNRYKVNVFCCAQLGNDNKNVEQIVGGGIDFTVTATGSYAAYIDTLNLTMLPFMFDSYEQGWKFYDTSTWLKAQFDKGPAKGFRLLATWEAGFRSMSTKDPLNTPADAKGKKMRTFPNEMMRWLLEDIGFGVQIMPLPEVYLGIQQGVIAGQENPVDTIYSNKFYEVAPNITLTRHVYSPIPLVISEKTWQKLSPADQKGITQAAQEAGAWNRQEVKDSEDNQLAEMAGKGAKINRTPNMALFRDAVKPTYEKAKAKWGADTDTVLAETAAIRKAFPVKK